jgi:hypothetical protein
MKSKAKAAPRARFNADSRVSKTRNEVKRNNVTPAMIEAAVLVYRAWESENMLDGDVPAMAGPSAVKELVSAVLTLAEWDASVAEKHPNSHPSL